MDVVIVNAVFPPEPVVSAKIGFDLAVHLCRNGHKVTVLCPYPTRPISAVFSGFTKKQGIHVSREECGATVVRLPSFTAPAYSFIKRFCESWSFGRHASRYISKHLKDSDIVYANTWPYLSQWWIGHICKRLNKPLIFHIVDLYPESLLNRLPSWLARLFAPFLFYIERHISRMASGIIVLSDGFRESYLLRRDVPSHDVKTIENWINDQPFDVQIDRESACIEYDVPSGLFTFLFFGNIGPVAGVDLLIEAFGKANIKNAQLVIAGDGSMKEQCALKAKEFTNHNIRFISDPDLSAGPKIQSLADVCLLPVKKGQAISSIPSKLMVYMVSGKPVIATVDLESESAKAILESKSGWIGPPEDASWLSKVMHEAVVVSEEQLKDAGSRARKFALQKYSRDVGVQQVTKFIEQYLHD